MIAPRGLYFKSVLFSCYLRAVLTSGANNPEIVGEDFCATHRNRLFAGCGEVVRDAAGRSEFKVFECNDSIDNSELRDRGIGELSTMLCVPKGIDCSDASHHCQFLAHGEIGNGSKLCRAKSRQSNFLAVICSSTQVCNLEAVAARELCTARRELARDTGESPTTIPPGTVLRPPPITTMASVETAVTTANADASSGARSTGNRNSSHAATGNSTTQFGNALNSGAVLTESGSTQPNLSKTAPTPTTAATTRLIGDSTQTEKTTTTTTAATTRLNDGSTQAQKTTTTTAATTPRNGGTTQAQETTTPTATTTRLGSTQAQETTTPTAATTRLNGGSIQAQKAPTPTAATTRLNGSSTQAQETTTPTAATTRLNGGSTQAQETTTTTATTTPRNGGSTQAQTTTTTTAATTPRNGGSTEAQETTTTTAVTLLTSSTSTHAAQTTEDTTTPQPSATKGDLDENATGEPDNVSAAVPANGKWGEWSSCTVTCGGGTRTRPCKLTSFVKTGKKCKGEGTEKCGETACMGKDSSESNNNKDSSGGTDSKDNNNSNDINDSNDDNNGNDINDSKDGNDINDSNDGNDISDSNDDTDDDDARKDTETRHTKNEHGAFKEAVENEGNDLIKLAIVFCSIIAVIIGFVLWVQHTKAKPREDCARSQTYTRRRESFTGGLVSNQDPMSQSYFSNKGAINQSYFEVSEPDRDKLADGTLSFRKHKSKETVKPSSGSSRLKMEARRREKYNKPRKTDDDVDGEDKKRATEAKSHGSALNKSRRLPRTTKSKIKKTIRTEKTTDVKDATKAADGSKSQGVKKDESPKTVKIMDGPPSPKMEQKTQTAESPKAVKIVGGPMSPKMDEEAQRAESPKVVKINDGPKSPKMDEKTKGGESPKVVKVVKSRKSQKPGPAVPLKTPVVGTPDDAKGGDVATGKPPMSSATVSACSYAEAIEKAAEKEHAEMSEEADSEHFARTDDLALKLLYDKQGLVVGRMLGQGSFGRVMLAKKKEGINVLAVKEISIDTTSSNATSVLEECDNELNVLQKIHHPNINAYQGHDYFPSRENPTHLLIMLQYESGGTIQIQLQQFGAFSDALIIRYTSQILAGIFYLHSQDPSIVHRDLKPANLLLDKAGVVKIADFGCAKTKSIANVLGDGTIKGTISYMAPEVFYSKEVGVTQDIWSFGCVVWEMCTAETPWREFEIKSFAHAFEAIADGDKLPTVPKDRPASLVNFIYSCLTRNPFQRKSALQLSNHLLFTQKEKNAMAAAAREARST